MAYKSTRRRRAPARRDNTLFYIIGALVLAAIVIGALLVLNSNANTPTATSSALAKCGKPTCGQENAPVTVEIYSDFQ